jgi:hypothetical protein
MNRDDIIRMAREAGIGWLERAEGISEFLEHFASLVAAAERERIKWDTIHTCNPHCDRPACVAVRRAREDEREMCAKVAEDMGNIDGNMNKTWRNGCFDAAFAIRERGAPALEKLNKAAEDNGEPL